MHDRVMIKAIRHVAKVWSSKVRSPPAICRNCMRGGEELRRWPRNRDEDPRRRSGRRSRGGGLGTGMRGRAAMGRESRAGAVRQGGPEEAATGMGIRD